MAFFKVCTCGEKILFERGLSFPDNCPSCGRKLVDFLTYNEDDPDIEKLMKSNSREENAEKIEGRSILEEANGGIKKYILKLNNGKEISIPEEGCIVGRTETGAEELAEFPSVSRQHLRVIPRSNVGVLVEDISTYGTLLDGQRIAKNSPVRVVEGTRIALCDFETILMIKEANS